MSDEGKPRTFPNSLPRFACIAFVALLVSIALSEGVCQKQSISAFVGASDPDGVDQSWAIEETPIQDGKQAAEGEDASNLPTEHQHCQRLLLSWPWKSNACVDRSALMRTTGTRRRLKVYLQERKDIDFALSTCIGNLSNLLHSSSPIAFKITESIENENTLLKLATGRFFSHKLPYDAILLLNLEDFEWMKCTSSITSEVSGHAKLEVLEVERNLIGNGAHRKLDTLLTIRLEEMSTCHMVTVEKLQPGVFADKFELDGLVARRVYTNAQVYGDHNLELPSLLSSQSMVVLSTVFSTGKTNSNGLGLTTQVKVSLPLHARYPPLSMESHVLVNLGLPYVLFQCDSEIADINHTKMHVKTSVWTVISWSKSFSMESGVLQWAVPAGNPVHIQFVTLMTAFTALLGVVTLLFVSNYSFRVLK